MFAESYNIFFVCLFCFPFFLFLGLLCTFEIGVERRPHVVVRADERHSRPNDAFIPRLCPM
jgi:hypothetical protein